MNNKLLTKIIDNSATIGIIGLGYVGLSLVIRFVEEKFKVIGFDIDNAKCSTLNSGKIAKSGIFQQSKLGIMIL